MFDFFFDIANYSFMRNALAACLLSSVGCGVVGAYVVVKRIGFFAGGIAHTTLAGVGIAYFMGHSPLIGAVIAALIAAVFMSLIQLYWKQQQDVLVAAFWSVGMAIGVLFLAKTPGYSADLMSFLFGNILLISKNDLLLMAALDCVILAVVFLFHKQFVAIIFDQEFARLRGIKVEVYYTLLMVMASLTVVLLIQMVGLALVIALLILPAACATQFFHSLHKIMLAATLICALMTVGGLSIAYHPNLPAGATIIVFAGACYALSVALGKALKRRAGSA